MGCFIVFIQIIVGKHLLFDLHFILNTNIFVARL
jgi:hypothetical protein